MPRGDGTGPMGLGPMTGRAAGYCAGYPVPGFMNPIGGRWFGFGRGLGLGRGRGWRWMYYATGLPGWARFRYPGWVGYPGWATPGYPAYYGAPFPGASYAGQVAQPTSEQEMAFLKQQAEYLREELKEIEERLKDLGSSEKDKAEGSK
ncbi:MAG TPA: DUF5320 domain-containing protein [Firmicutes bacterium]|nr:DUF5320 domain-containing protein [Bacillota bacterium]